jgi:hypothetical protein
MSAVTRFFFRNEISCRTPADIIAWWEARRLPFNIAVGTTGVITLAAIHIISRLPPDPIAVPTIPSLVSALIYGVAANVCYTAGWLTEIAIRKRSSDDLEPVGPALFRYGFVFSIGLTLFPIAVVSLARLVRFIFGFAAG